MISELKIRNFRRLIEVSLPDLKTINLITGMNGTGKTTVLEALWLLIHPGLPLEASKLGQLRGYPTFNINSPFHDLFAGFEASGRASIEAHGDWGERARKLNISTMKHPQTRFALETDSSRAGILRDSGLRDESDQEIVFEYLDENGASYETRGWIIRNQLTTGDTDEEGYGFEFESTAPSIDSGVSACYMPPSRLTDVGASAEAFGQIQLRGEAASILKMLQNLDERVQSIVPITVNGVNIIHVKIAGVKGPIPIQYLGEGFARMFALAVYMRQIAGGVLLVDELENGLHHRSVRSLFGYLQEMSRLYDVQVFATTHSVDCVRSAYEVLGETGDQDYSFYRSQDDDDEIDVIHMDHRVIETALELRWEMR